MRQGWDVMRFWVQQVRDQLPWCAEQVKRWMEQNDLRNDKHAQINHINESLELGLKVELV